MANPAEKKSPRTPEASNDVPGRPSSSSSIDRSRDAVDRRQSQEIVVALCGPIGCGIRDVKEQLRSVLHDEQYEVFVVRVSEEIEEFLSKTEGPRTYDKNDKAARYNALMNSGNDLRKLSGNQTAAELAMREISLLRGDTSEDETFAQSKRVGLTRRAYIIDQLKHPDEVRKLKQIYGSLFYLVGVLCDEDRRERSLSEEGISTEDAHALILRDKRENIKYGQQLEKTLQHADFFINNSNPNASATRALLERFLKLAHGGKGITPTKEEFGMYAAYSASLQSACLSRQVGASIADQDGAVISVGHNDVPKFGGGLYTEDDNVTPNSVDNRCIHRDQRCHNDKHKVKLRDTLAGLLASKLYDTGCSVDTDQLADELYKESEIKSLIEYSRAIHAEMDAILSLATGGSGVPRDCTMYTTTFPCHNCARHIISAGITKVVYIEPYEKSLALTLHDDALSHAESSSKVWLKPFQGVSPGKYQAFFANTTPFKDEQGRVIASDRGSRLQIDPEFVDSYIELEGRVAAGVFEREESGPKTAVPVAPTTPPEPPIPSKP